MQFSEQWLRSWVNPSLTTDQLSNLLTMAGLEVEAVQAVASAFRGVKVAEIKAVTKHANADRLCVVMVDVGTDVLLQIVCGARNVSVGLKVPCALPGAVLPGGGAIKRTNMRGVISDGMLCSGDELGISNESDGLLVLPAGAPLGVELCDYLALDDQLFTLKVTPNRPDCLSIRGIAREVSALTGAELVAFPIPPVRPVIDDGLSVNIEASGCGRYLGRVLKGVNAAATTPDWMRRRLESAGVELISAVVDITNYVLLELGQPMHAFDLSKLEGGIVVRMAREGEYLTCLNGKKVRLTPNIMVLADRRKVLAVAGMMGGEYSGVTTSSNDVFMESAFFSPESIAGKSRELGFSSNSAFCYERGVDFLLQGEAMERATHLVLDICGGQPGTLVEVVAELPLRSEVKLRPSRCEKLLGVTLCSQKIGEILRRLGLAFRMESDVFIVTPPSFRFDISIEEDLIEEVARIYGYDRIPDVVPRSGMRILAQREELKYRDQIRHLLAARGYQEVVSYSFVDEAWELNFSANAHPVRLVNPIASQMSVMRSTLIGSLLDVLVKNINRKQPRVRVFEVARVFKTSEDWFDQPEKVAGLAWGSRLPEQWGIKSERVDFFDVKADLEVLLQSRKIHTRKAEHPAFHPGRSAEILVDTLVVGVIGELHPKWVQRYDLFSAPVLFELDLCLDKFPKPIKVQPVSKFPTMRRDLALLVDEKVETGQMLACFAKYSAPIVSEVVLFDVYHGPGVAEGKKSLAFRVLLQDQSRTLTDEDVEGVLKVLVDGVAVELGARLR